MTGNTRFCDMPQPDLTGPALALAAGLAELFAERCGQSPPAWTIKIGPLDADVLLVRAARRMPRLPRLCETEGPLPLRRRRLLAPPDYLTFAAACLAE